MKKFRYLIAFLVISALLSAGGSFAFASEGQDTEHEEEVCDPTFILPMLYWQT